MLDSVILLSLATIIAILAIMVYLGVYAYRHIRDDSNAQLTQAKEVGAHKRV